MDKISTERRSANMRRIRSSVSDLRDLGFHVDWKKVADEDQ